MRRTNRTPVWLVLLFTAVIAAGCGRAVADAGRSAGPGTTQTEPEQERATPGPEPSATPGRDVYQEGFTELGQPFRGRPDAPILIEEFSSYQCPFCARHFLESYRQIVATYVKPGHVVYIFRDFPLPTQPQSTLAAEAANCAGQAGGGSAYWAMHDRLFERQGEWSGNVGALVIFERYAGDLGLDTGAFRECLATGATRGEVEADAAEGRARGVTGTPTFFVDGRRVVGVQPYAVMAEAIDAALGGERAQLPEPTAEVAAPNGPVPTLTPAAMAPSEAALALGDAGAAVTIVEFSDYQCPFCASHSRDVWPRLKANFVDTGRVRYVFKDFPLTALHPQVPKAHEAARCAGEQGAYWDMHDRLYDGQPEWSAAAPGDGSVFKRYADELGLERGAFDACLDSGRWGDVVAAEVAEGVGLGVRGTPTFYIDGYPLVGMQDYELFEYAIDLAEQGRLTEAYEYRP